MSLTLLGYFLFTDLHCCMRVTCASVALPEPCHGLAMVAMGFQDLPVPDVELPCTLMALPLHCHGLEWTAMALARAFMTLSWDCHDNVMAVPMGVPLDTHWSVIARQWQCYYGTAMRHFHGIPMAVGDAIITHCAAMVPPWYCHESSLKPIKPPHEMP